MSNGNIVDIINVLHEKGIKNSEIARDIGVSESSVSLWSSGKRTPTTPVVNLILDFYGIKENSISKSPDYVLINSDHELEKIKNEFDLDNISAAIIAEYSKLSKKEKQICSDFIQTVLKRAEKADAPDIHVEIHNK